MKRPETLAFLLGIVVMAALMVALYHLMHRGLS